MYKKDDILSIQNKSDFFIPPTISREAQNILRQFTFEERNSYVMPREDDLPGWKREWKKSIERRREINTQMVAQYQPSLENIMLGSVKAIDIKPQGWIDNGKLIVYFHGGAYTFFDAESSFISSVPLADESKLRIISVSYTTAPFAQWQEIINQAISAMDDLIRQGYSYKDMAVLGDSAGAGLATGAILKMRDSGKGMPGVVVLWSPWSDITETGDTYITLKEEDPILLYSQSLEACANVYAKPEEQKNPYVSPVYADYSTGFPPTLIQGGTKEIFLSNCIRHYQALDQAGVTVKLDLYEGMWHVFQALNPDLPESKLARKKTKEFIRCNIG